MSRIEDIIVGIEVRSLRFWVVTMLSIIFLLLVIDTGLNVWRLFVLDTEVKTLTNELTIVRHRLDVERNEKGIM